MDCYNYKSEYLYKAIEDNANTIRFIDTKVGAVFVGISISITMIQLMINPIQNLYTILNQNLLSQGLLILLFGSYSVCIVLTVIYGFRAIKSKDSAKVELEDCNVSELWYINNTKKGRGLSLPEFYKKLKDMSQDECLKSILLELLKLNQVRNQKLINANKSIQFFVYSLIPLGMIFLCILLFCFR